ncbi:MAG: putative phosphoenolpyruvate synthase regulatory protein [marine bacterium B5-7]|nr:MAG: putative phosphoenolpyruvate synthase regulatory protein [marine bacterium B5-7]
MSNRPVFVVSDRTGITAEMMSHSLLTQFPNVKFDVTTLPFVDTDDKVSEVIKQINDAGEHTGVRPLIFLTFVDDAHRARLLDCGGVSFDLFGTFLDPLEQELDHKSSHSIGVSHGIVDPVKYTNRIGAVNYAVHCDDGLNVRDYPSADVILVGVSRAGKTPVSLYLAMQFGVHCANYPLTDHDLERSNLPPALEDYRDRLFGLTIRPERLQQIRQERRNSSRYASIQQCRYELSQAEQLYLRYRIPSADTTSLSIEEIATGIIQKLRLKRDIY